MKLSNNLANVHVFGSLVRFSCDLDPRGGITIAVATAIKHGLSRCTRGKMLYDVYFQGRVFPSVRLSDEICFYCLDRGRRRGRKTRQAAHRVLTCREQVT